MGEGYICIFLILYGYRFPEHLALGVVAKINLHQVVYLLS